MFDVTCFPAFFQALCRYVNCRYDTKEQLLVDLQEETEDGKLNPGQRHFRRPYKMLLAWALLLKQYVV